MNLKYTVSPKIIGDSKIEITTSIDEPLAKHTREISKAVLDLQDKAVREALIKLGWTPPASKFIQTLKENMDKVEEWVQEDMKKEGIFHGELSDEDEHRLDLVK